MFASDRYAPVSGYHDEGHRKEGRQSSSAIGLGGYWAYQQSGERRKQQGTGKWGSQVE